MENPIYINESDRREETMAVMIIFLQLILLSVIYLYFNSESFQDSNNILSSINDKSTNETSSQPYSSRNIVDVAWTCQYTILPNGEYGCAK
jgi:hypothetical protein